MTKGDEIRNMPDEQLAEFLDKLTAACYDDSLDTHCPLFDDVCGGCNKNLILKRLHEQTSAEE
jgi:hypothetical protein